MYVMYRILIYFLSYASARPSELDVTKYYNVGDTLEIYCERPNLPSDSVFQWTKVIHEMVGHKHTIPRNYTPPHFTYTLTASELDHGSKLYCKGKSKNIPNNFDINQYNTVTLMQADRTEDAFINQYNLVSGKPEYNDTMNFMHKQSIGATQKKDIDDSYMVESSYSTFQVFVFKITTKEGLCFTRRINEIRSPSGSFTAYCVGSVSCLFASILLVVAFLWLRYKRKNRRANDLSNQDVIYAVPDQVTYAELDLGERVSHGRLLPPKLNESPYAQVVGYLSRKR